MISVLLPFHREGALLGRAIDSVKQQSYRDWQLILVANGADSETLEVAEQSAKGESRIQIYDEPESGIAYALNTGLSHCRGELIARLDADDEMPPDRLQLQAKFLDENPDIGLVSGQVNFIHAPKQVATAPPDNTAGYDAYVAQINSWQSEDDILRYRFVESPVAHPSVMFRRELIDRYGMYSTAAVPEDYELWMRWLSAGVRFAKIPQTVLNWYDSPGRLSRTHANYARRAFDAVRLEHLLQVLPELVKGRPLWFCGGKYARKKIAQLAAQGLHVTGVVDFMNRQLHNLQSLTYDQLPPAGEIFLVSMVSNRGGYRIVERALTERGYRHDEDFLLAG